MWRDIMTTDCFKHITDFMSCVCVGVVEYGVDDG